MILVCELLIQDFSEVKAQSSWKKKQFGSMLVRLQAGGRDLMTTILITPTNSTGRANERSFEATLIYFSKSRFVEEIIII